jgi:hypothetical protein
VVGPTIGTNYAYLVHVAGNLLCPENLEQVNANSSPRPWYYLDVERSWRKDDSSIELKCTY